MSKSLVLIVVSDERRPWTLRTFRGGRTSVLIRSSGPVLTLDVQTGRSMSEALSFFVSDFWSVGPFVCPRITDVSSLYPSLYPKVLFIFVV